MRTIFVLAALILSLAECANVSLGNFQKPKHGVTGQLIKVSDKSLMIKSFNYDGLGNLRNLNKGSLHKKKLWKIPYSGGGGSAMSNSIIQKNAVYFNAIPLSEAKK